MDIINGLKDWTFLQEIGAKYLVLTLLCLAVADVITGITNAMLDGNVQSAKMRQGIVGKLYEFTIVAIALALDYVFNVHLIFKATTVFYIIQEIISILENTAKHVKYPLFVTNTLKLFSSKIGGDNGTEKHIQ